MQGSNTATPTFVAPVVPNNTMLSVGGEIASNPSSANASFDRRFK